MSASSLDIGDWFWLETQRRIGWFSSPVWAPAVVAIQNFVLGWSIEDVEAVRAEYRQLRSSDRPLLICANHLTLVDSAIIALALGSATSYLLDYGSLPWNLPERENFAGNPLKDVLVYIMKCIPITRGSSREDIGKALAKVSWLLKHRETALIFPEGGRSRSGRINLDAATYGPGRIVNAVPGCRVLCVYLRGGRQTTWSDFPARGERFRVLLDCFEPRSEQRGIRASVDVSRQILQRLAGLEARYFHAHKRERRRDL